MPDWLRFWGSWAFWLLSSLSLIATGLTLHNIQETAAKGQHHADKALGAWIQRIQPMRQGIDRARNADLDRQAQRLASASQALSTLAAHSRIDYDGIEQARKGLAASALGLEKLANSLDPARIVQMAGRFEETGRIIRDRIVPAATSSADRLSASAGPLSRAIDRLTHASETLHFDLEPIRQVHNSLGRLESGLAAFEPVLDPKIVLSLGQAAEGASGVIDQAATLSERAGGYTYPIISMRGLQPSISQRPFWPEGKKIGNDLKQVAAGVSVVQDQTLRFAQQLPQIQESIRDSRKGLESTRQLLGGVLARQEQVDLILKDLPKQGAELARTLPTLLDGLESALRQVQSVQTLADNLDLAADQLRTTAQDWPTIRDGLLGASHLLLTASQQLQTVSQDRDNYDLALNELAELSSAFSTALPVYTDDFQAQIEQGDRALSELELSLVQIRDLSSSIFPMVDRVLGLAALLSFLTGGVLLLRQLWVLGQFPSVRAR